MKGVKKYNSGVRDKAEAVVFTPSKPQWLAGPVAVLECAAEHRSEVWYDGIPDSSSLHGWVTKIPLIFSQNKAEW